MQTLFIITGILFILILYFSVKINEKIRYFESNGITFNNPKKSRITISILKHTLNNLDSVNRSKFQFSDKLLSNLYFSITNIDSYIFDLYVRLNSAVRSNKLRTAKYFDSL